MAGDRRRQDDVDEPGERSAGMRAGASSPRRYVRSTTSRETLVKVEDADLAADYAVRIRGANLTWRVMLTGFAGEEELATGTIAAGAPQTVRVTGLPEVLAGSILWVDALLTAAGDAEEVQAELGWRPIFTDRGPK